MDVWSIRTPTDLRGAFAHAARAHFVAVPDELETEAREAWDEIFEDFQLMEPDVDPPGLISSYLEGVAEPLARLQQLGLQLVAVKTSGTIEILGMTTHGTQTDFILAPRPLWFRRGEAGAVHLLGARCLEGHKAFTGNDGEAVHLWRSSEAVDVSFEQSTPWCATCAIGEVETLEI